MTQDQLQRLREAVVAWLRANPGPVIGRGVLAAVADAVRAEAGEASELELHVAVALCALGPAFPAPSLTVFDDLLATIVERFGGELDRVLEATIAYGCGCWRNPEPLRGPWFGRWDGAQTALAHALEPPVREVLRWLARVTGLPRAEYWSFDEGREIVWLDAGQIAASLVHPISPLHSKEEGARVDITHTDDGCSLLATDGCLSRFVSPGSRCILSNDERAVTLCAVRDGERATFEFAPGTVTRVVAADEDTQILPSRPPPKVFVKPEAPADIAPASALTQWNCGCGNVRCVERHRLDGWAFDQHSLWSFVASAVKGPGRSITDGTLATGMYLPLLGQCGAGEFGRLRRVPVEFHYCSTPECAAANERFHQPACPSCRRPFDPKSMRSDCDDHLILLSHPALWNRVPRIRCPNDGNLYQGSACPLCKSAARQNRPTWVWVPLGGPSGEDREQGSDAAEGDDTDTDFRDSADEPDDNAYV